MTSSRPPAPGDAVFLCRDCGEFGWRPSGGRVSNFDDPEGRHGVRWTLDGARFRMEGDRAVVEAVACPACRRLAVPAAAARLARDLGRE